MKSVLCLLSAVLFVVYGVQAQADARQGQGYFSPMATYIDDDKDRAVDDGVSGGQVGLGAALHEHWNMELFIHGASLDGFDEQDHFGAGVDFQWLPNRSARLTPYLFGGVGYLEVERGTATETGAAWSAGAGLLADIFGSSGVAVRAEYRYRTDDALSGSLSDHLVSVGLQIPFGSTEAPVVDSDRDGVADGRDRCPGTPLGTPVDEFGCEQDSDGDGVADSADRCPGTPAGAEVDRQGCELDSDGDGVADGRDRCPGTVRGATVDGNGCELDSDGDGVVDRLDRCPGTARGVQVDVAGCEIKEEIRLPGVTFETNSDRLLPGAEQVLIDAAATLRKNPTIKVEVAGHTDSDGAEAYNEELSERRARTVRDFLSAQDVDADRMTVRGYGESRPIADNSTADGKAQNRRVVLRVTSR